MPSSSRRSSFGSRSSILGFKLRRNGLNNGNRESTGQLTRRNVEGGETDGIVKVPVIGYEVMEARERFTVYKLQIENEEMGESWLVCRRYTDFQRLAVKLKDEFPDLFINLPPKRWLKNNFDTTFLDDRMKGIQAFVDSILVQHQLATSQTVRTFFCLDEPPMYPENAEESRAMFGNVEENVMQLKEIINEKDDEIELLKTQLELTKLRNEVLTKKLNRACRTCNLRILSTSTLSPPGRNGVNMIPVQTSTPNSDEGSAEMRSRNRSSRSDSSSTVSTPKASPGFKSPDGNSSYPGPATGQLETIPIEMPTASSTPMPPNQEALMANSSVDATFSTPNSVLLPNGGDSIVSDTSPPFEIMSSSTFRMSSSKEVDGNSSFEVLSPSVSESDSLKDSNHNKKDATHEGQILAG